jgi:hypothetical protein
VHVKQKETCSRRTDGINLTNRELKCCEHTI